MRARLRKVRRRLAKLPDGLQERLDDLRNRRERKRTHKGKLLAKIEEKKAQAMAEPEHADRLREKVAELEQELKDTKTRIEAISDRIKKATRLLERKNTLRATERRLQRKLKRRRKGGADKAIAWALSKVGITESPAGSNWGPEIGEWIRFTGYSGPVFWCGCFVAYAVVKIAGASIPNVNRLGYDGYINADATNGANGLQRVPLSEAKPGDIVTFSFHHIALFLRLDGGYIETVDGNTSGATADNNGGGVYRKRRPASYVTCVARPNY